MSQYWIIAAIVLPFLGAAAIPLLPFRSRNGMLWYIETVVLVTSAIVAALLLGGFNEVIHDENGAEYKNGGEDAEKCVVQRFLILQRFELVLEILKYVHRKIPLAMYP